MASPLHQASDPLTPPRQLQALSTHRQRAVRAAVAANGAAPLPVLLSLLNEFPEQVLGNAALMLHMIENLSVFREAPEEQQQQWAGNAAMPGWLLEQLGHSDSEDVRAALATNPSTPPALLERLAFPDEFGDDEDVWLEPRHEVVDNPNASPGLRFDVALCMPEPDPEFSDPPSAEICELLLEDQEEIEELFFGVEAGELRADQVWSAEIPDEGEDEWASPLYRDPTGVYTEAWGNEGVYGGLLDGDEGGEGDEGDEGQVPGDEWASIWGATSHELVGNPATPWPVLRRLVGRLDGGLRGEALSHPSAPSEWLGRLGSSPEPKVRRFVAGHPATPAGVLATLARAAEPRVRLSAATNPSTPAEALALLATDDSAAIRRAVASNPSAPAAALTRLGRDHRPSVRRAAEVRACRLAEGEPRWTQEPAVSSAA